MASKKNRKQSQKKSRVSRIKTLETEITQLKQLITAAFQTVDQAIGSMKGVVDGLVEAVGEDVVAAARNASDLRKAQEQLSQVQANLKTALESGRVVPTYRVAADSLIVTEESNADGSPVGVGTFYFGFDQVKPELKELILGQVVGWTHQLEGGTTLTIKEIYKPGGATATPAEVANG